MIRRTFHSILILGFFVTVGLSRPQDQGGSVAIDYETARFERVARAVPISMDEEIVIDGKPNDVAWAKAEPATNFIQWEPNPGAPATEKTEVRFLYDADNLYIGVRCFDSEPHRLVVNEMKDDISGGEEDYFAIVLDTLHDHRSGFFLGVNPAGGRKDSQVANDGVTENIDWDGVWEVKASRDEQGWSAEYKIPFKTLRFTNAPSQVWGINMLRRVRRKNEDSQWSPLPRRFRTTRVSMAGTLVGLENIRQGGSLKIKPYVSGGFTEVRSADTPERDGVWDGGVDVKYGLTQSLTIDLTYRTDFSQVEVDQQQINLTRFSLFFPEKREFFLENSGTFFIAGANNNTSAGINSINLLPFFSRRIGLSSSGEPIPMIGGGRISGKTGLYDIGMLAMKTKSIEGLPSNNFVVGRVKRNFLGNSYAGAIITNRDSRVAGDFNRVYGVDTFLRFHQRFEIASYLLGSNTPGKSGSNQARLFSAGWLDDDVTIFGQYEEVQSNFNPEVGFVRRKNLEHYTGNLSWRPRLNNSRQIRNLNFSSDADYYAGSSSGKVETRDQSASAGITFRNNAVLSFEALRTFDRLVRPFNIRPGIAIPDGDYTYRHYSASFNSNRSKKISGTVKTEWGDFWNGQQTSAGGGLAVRPHYRFNMDLTYSLNRVSLPAGSFSTHLVGSKFLYAFSPKISLNAFLQYNADTDQFISNIRFNVIHRPLSDLFIVYNDRRDTRTGQFIDRTFMVKLTNLFDF